VASHNTVQFDGLQQMPRVSRFLFGDWLKTADRGTTRDSGGTGFFAAYRHQRGWRHRREVRLAQGQLRVIDDLSGFGAEARLRWRLAPGNWVVDGTTVTKGSCRLSVSADVPIVNVALTTGFESRHYLEISELPVLEVVLGTPGKITSEFSWVS
jgi:Heparinase II/III-like protein